MGVCPECGAAISMNDDVVQGEILEPVSYTHLTLPTILLV